MNPLIMGLLPKLADIFDKVIPDKAAAAIAQQAFEMELLQAANEANKQQAEINKVEAQSSSVWVSGWRPAIGWVCAIGVFWAFVGNPLAVWFALALGYPNPLLPLLPTDALFELVFAMLGMAGLRSFDKLKGLSK
jgi:hypothetical protein